VVVHFDRAAIMASIGSAHGRTDVVQAVDRRNREVTALDGRTVAGVASTIVFSPEVQAASASRSSGTQPDMSTLHSTESKMKNSGSGPK
jgi:hypothetical protein